MRTNSNDTAFAHSGYEDLNYKVEAQSGLTKREYFAAQALSGLTVAAIPGSHNRLDYDGHGQNLARYAVLMADALIEELNKKGGF